MKRQTWIIAGLVCAAIWLAGCSSRPAYTCQPTQFGRDYPYGSPAFSFSKIWFYNEDKSLWAGLDADEQDSVARFPFKSRTDWKIMWWRSDKPKEGSPVHVEARRLDSEAPKPSATGQYVSVAQTLTILVIPSAGCWQVTGTTSDKSVTFVMELTE